MRPGRLERPHFDLEDRCSVQLSYGRADEESSAPPGPGKARGLSPGWALAYAPGVSDAPPPAPAPDPRERAGGLLFAGGGLLLTALAGAGLGYWAADREVRWLPTMLGALLVLGVLAVIGMAVGLYLQGPVAGRRRGRRRIVALGVLAVVGAAGRLGVEWAAAPSPLTAMTPEAFERCFRLDARQARELDRALEQVVQTLEAQGDLFGTAEGRVPSADEEALLIDAWQAYLTAAVALDRLRLFYEDYYGFDLSRAERPRHLRAYLLTFMAELALYERTADLVDVLERNANVVKLLDLPRPERHLPAGGVARLREELAGVADLSRVIAGKRYLRWLAAAHGADREAAAAGLEGLWRDVERRLLRLEARRARDLAALTVGSDLAPLRRKVKAWTFPVQAGVAEWLGDTRVGRPTGQYLIGAAELAQVGALLAPGDVMLGRKNWYLSNVGLPGFWPHALLYVGTPGALARTFDDDPEVRAWVRREAGADLAFTEHLARAFPRAWAEALAAERAGDPLVIIEAVSEGVVQSTLAGSSGDYLAALRPRLPAWVKAQAVARAFAYLGRPYDFDFDFATDTSLVCTELVWRSYRPLGDAPGLRLETVKVAGRQTLPANELARCFQREHGRPDRQLDFVAFVDGREAERRALVADEPAFLATPDRPKWDVAQR